MEYVIRLPKPISVNNLFASVGKHARIASERYRLWRAECESMMMAAGPRTHVPGPVSIRISMCPDGVSAAFDTDNASKAYVDTLVRMGVLADDTRRTVAELALDWRETEPGAVITVRAMEGGAG